MAELAVPYPASVVRNLERSAERSADRCSIQQGDAMLSYGDLWTRANCVADYLRGEGLRVGDRVALLLDNSTELVAALYGTLLAGGIAVTLNTAARARECTAWLRHSEARWLVASADNAEAALALADLQQRPNVISSTEPGQNSPIAATAYMSGLYATRPTFSHELACDPASPACIMYTSGTTGNPKGVVLTHGNLASNAAAVVQYLELTSADSVLSILPFYYSYGSSLLHTHIQVGGRLVLEQNFIYPHLVVASLAKHRVTGFAGVPSTYALLLSRVDVSQYDMSALRYITQAGGSMSPALTQRVRAALPNARLFVMYGQTEATARLTYLPPDALERKLGSVGIPVNGVEIQVRRDDGAVAQPLETGEVWAHGPNVMQGYWRDPAATQSVLQNGWLKTGDMGWQDADGYLFLSGRRSDMIKTGAHRVHPTDVEEVIQELAGVAEVAVAGIDDEVLGQAIAVFVVPAPGAQLDPLQIKTHCRARLATYKVPKSIEFVAALPKTASGKVRRQELVQRKQL